MIALLPCLDAKMKQAKASNESLAEASGVNVYSIAMTRRHGRGMQKENAIAVYQALNTRTFNYKKRGPKT